MTARVWDWRTGKLAGPPMTHAGEVQDVRFLNADRWALTKTSVGHMVTSRENAVQVWDWREGKALTPSRRLISAWGSQLGVSNDGRRIVLGDTASARLHV